MVYTVDEVSSLLDIPRPTLYRYLREYSIPHLRRSGKISIPEESFERIREARELHREGLGTESVRRRLREGDDLDAEELAERLDRLSEALESLRGDLRPAADGVSYSQETLQAVLAKQDLLISAVSGLTERMDGLLTENDRPPRATLISYPERPHEQKSVETEDGPGTNGVRGADEPAARISTGSMELSVAPAGRERFGELSRRRRRALLLLLPVLLAGAFLAWSVLPSSDGEEIAQPNPVEQIAGEEPPAIPVVDEAPRTVRIPDLLGLTLPEAEAELVEAGLEPGARDEFPSNEIPAGTVVGQAPAVDAEVEPNTRVKLIVRAAAPPLESQDSSDAGSVPYPPGDAQYQNGGFGPGLF